MISVYIESKDRATENRIRYVMKQILIPMGFPFKFQTGLEKIGDTFLIACIHQNTLKEKLYDQKFDLIIPYDDYNLWSANNPDIKADKVDGIYVLYIGRIPKYLIHDGKVGFDLINIVFFLLSRQEEYIYKHRDLWDCFSATYTTLYEHGIIGFPVINYYIDYLESYIRQRIKFVPKPKWKDGASYAVVLSHDIDNLSSRDITIILNQILCARKSSIPISTMVSSVKEFLLLVRANEASWDLANWIDKERHFGFRSTFFLSANTPRRHPDDPTYWLHSKIMYEGKKVLVKRAVKVIEDKGWEIGLHGSMNSYRDQELLSIEKELLIEQTGCSVVGVRQHYLRLDIHKTWQIHESLGFSYDTTLGFNERNGFRSGIAFPFTPYNLPKEQEYNLLELPMAIMDTVFFANHAEKLDTEKAIWRCGRIIDEIEKTHGLLVVNFHPNYYLTTHPGWWELYSYVLKRLSESHVWVATGREITEWWKEKSLIYNV